MMVKTVLVAVVVIILFTAGIGGCMIDSDTLKPEQVNESLLDTVVKVRGKITDAIENPMGQGGIYMTLDNGQGDVDVRIPPEKWDSYEEKTKRLYREGRTVTVEGILFRAGNNLVVVHGKYDFTSGRNSSGDGE
jgi:hypothetical protein